MDAGAHGIGKPKPTKRARHQEKQEEHADLVAYRQQQVRLAIWRDNSQCVFCHFLHKRNTPRSQVHHVYGRDRGDSRWRENHENLLCVCDAHHYPPIHEKGASATLEFVERVREQANARPVNHQFRPPQNVSGSELQQQDSED